MEHLYCIDTNVECRFHKKGKPCNKCLDITEATNFLLKYLKPKSGTLKRGIMNNDYAAYLITIFSNQKHNDLLQRLKKGNEYLMEIEPYNITVEETLEAFGFNKNNN